ncbi:response regulator transcription factor [Methylobacter svalbardensis]|uniref:response regulator transcription factor n=1 Tax=Methylobacter svalbardensis TaxID=3080016 RepID=UPI0030ED3387
MTINLVLVDDHPLVLNGLQQLFSMEPDINVLASCSDGEQALQTVINYQPDILILDLKMPRKNGLEVLRELQQKTLPTKVVLLTAALDDDEVLEAIRLGVRGVVLKEMAPQLLIQCINKVHAGGEWLEKDSVGRALEKMLKRETEMQLITQILTPRELKLVKLVAGGLSNKQIAEKLYITEGTVKVHLHNIYDKLQVKSRVALTLYAQEKGVV